MSKKCHLCIEEKSLTEFYKDKYRKDGYGERCKECVNIRRELKCCFDLGYIYWEYSNGMTEQIGSEDKRGYLQFKLNGKLTSVHRYIYEQYHNVVLKPDEFLDHMDRNRLNNKIDNLRVVTAQQNAQNITHRENTSSKYKGVSWHKQKEKWQARIKYNKKQMHLGYFDDEIEAAKAYNKKAEEYNERYNCVYTINDV